MSMSFAQLGVTDSVIAALAKRGITEPFEIQAATIADSLAGRDVCGRAPTGSGKTLAFGIPIVINTPTASPRRPRALVLAPTRELAEQINAELRTFAGPVRIGVVYGGVGYGGQVKALRQGVEILVACPGRLEDLIAQGEVSLEAVERVVLDEADRMADMGFLPTVRRLLNQTAPGRQTVLFSATLDGDVAKLTADYQTDPVRHEVGEETPDITAASHRFWKVDRANRREVLAQAINATWPAIVFTRTRHGADRLTKQLVKDGIAAAAIHGGRSQSQRTRALSDFGRNKVHALVATDVAARGIHVDGVALVVHFDPPEDHKAYVHRSGRTARAGEAGVVLSLLQSDQIRDNRRTQRAVGIDEPVIDPDPAALRDLAPGPRPALRVETPRADRPAASDQGQAKSKANGRGRRSGNSQGQGQGQGKRRAPAKGQAEGRSPAKPRANSNGKPKASEGARAGGKPNSNDGSRQSSPGKPKPKSKARPSANGQGASKAGSTSQKNKRRHGAGPGSDGQPNRKARRAHLQSDPVNSRG
jgi:superfamily II DNA/RNA helicase